MVPNTPIHYGAVALQPERAVRYRVARGVRQVLVQWTGQSAASSTWEDVDDFKAKFPRFQLEDELSLGGEGDVMWGKTYTRRRRARDVRRAAERAARAHQEAAEPAQAAISG